MAQSTPSTNTTSTTPKPATPKAPHKEGSSAGIFPLIAIPVVILVCLVFFYTVMSDLSLFEGANEMAAKGMEKGLIIEKAHPVDNNILGLMRKGGVIVPFLMSMAMMVVVFSIERFITLSRATGKGSVTAFVRKIQAYLSGNNIAEALKECDRQQGSVGNVVNSVLHKYNQMNAEPTLSKDQKVLTIQKELEESTALELPMLEKNLVIIATLASVATLVGLLGTVVGMIKAFSALAAAGTPDASALSAGISEALINTALGIGTSAVAIIMYNYFTTRIDSLTHAIDEAGFSIIQNFQSKVSA
jgi:biopolymer transport protein ExbB